MLDYEIDTSTNEDEEAEVSNNEKNSVDDSKVEETTGEANTNEFMRVAVVGGKLHIIDGDKFDSAIFKDSVKKALSEYNFKKPEDKHEFISKICSAFSFATNDLISRDDSQTDDAKIDVAMSAMRGISTSRTAPLVKSDVNTMVEGHPNVDYGPSGNISIMDGEEIDDGDQDEDPYLG